MRFKGFSENWESVTISSLSKIVTKQTGFDYTNTIKRALIVKKTNGALPYIQTKNFHNKNVNYTTDYFIPISTADKFPKIKLDEKCILLSIVGASVGNIGFFDHKEDSFLSGAICVIKTKEQSFLNDIYHYMKSPYGQEQIKATTKGAAQATITIDDIRNYIIRRPISCFERKKLFDFLNLIDERISDQSKIINKLESLRKQINNNYFSSIQNHILFKSVYLNASEGGTPDTKNTSYYKDATIPFVKIDDLYSKYITKTKSFINKDGLKHSSAWIVPPNSVLLSNGATIGEVAINTIPVTTKQGILGIVPKDAYISEFLYYLFKSDTFRRQLKKITTKGTMDAAYLKDIDKLLIPSCSNVTQKKYIDVINKIERKIFNEKKIINLYIIQKKYFLSNLFI